MNELPEISFLAQVIVYIGIFVFGFIWGIAMAQWLLVRSLNKQFSKMLKTLQMSNRDNLNLIEQNKYLKNDLQKKSSGFPFMFPLGMKFVTKEIKGKEAENFLKNVFGENKDSEELDERKFLIEELTRLEAKGWSEEDSIEELRKLYDLLQ